MISLTEIIGRIRTQCPMFSNRVGGTPEFGQAFQDATADLQVPYCFVLPLDSVDVSTQFNLAEQTLPTQDVREFFSTIICVDNSVDRGRPGGGLSKLQPIDEIVLIQESLRLAFFGWRPLQKFEPVRFARGGSLGFDNKRLWHQFEWFVRYTEDAETPDSVQEAVDAYINAMDDPIPFEDSVLNKLRMIYVNYGYGPGPIGDHTSLDDFYADYVGNPGTTPASSDAIAAHQTSAELTIPVPTEIPPGVDPTPDEIQAKEAMPSPPADTFHHGPDEEQGKEVKDGNREASE